MMIVDLFVTCDYSPSCTVYSIDLLQSFVNQLSKTEAYDSE